MEELLNRLETQLLLKKPFVVYAKPGLNTVTAFFQHESHAYFLNDFNDEGFVFAPFSDGKPLLIPFEKSDHLQVTFSPEVTDSAQEAVNDTNTESKQNFERLVSLCVNEIKTGLFDKLVASRTEIVSINKNISQIYQALLYNYPGAFRYCFYHPESGLWMGATPEQLLKAQAEEIHTVALAGTQLYNADAEAVWENKEQQEQQFVTDYILKQLQKITTNVSTTKPYTFRAGTIVHIKTDISAKLSAGVHLGDVVAKLHPTPAVCGLPKDAARDFLIKNEGYNREYYSGFLGELNKDNTSDLFVNLRCMKVEQGRAQLFIGCGITKDSNPEKEFTETVNKSFTMRKVL